MNSKQKTKKMIYISRSFLADGIHNGRLLFRVEEGVVVLDGFDNFADPSQCFVLTKSVDCTISVCGLTKIAKQ